MIGITTGKLIKDHVLESAADVTEVRLVVSRHPLSARSLTLLVELPPAIVAKAEESGRDDFLAVHFLCERDTDRFYYCNFLPKKADFIHAARRSLISVDLEFEPHDTVDIVLILNRVRSAVARVQLRQIQLYPFEFTLPVDLILSDRERNADSDLEFACSRHSPNRSAISTLYVTGTEKSGTTWIENILTAHPAVLLLHEGNTLSFFSADAVQPENVATGSDLSYSGWYPQEPEIDQLWDISRAAVSEAIIGFYGSVWGAQVAGERTPNTTGFLTAPCRDFSSRVIHIVRHPLDVVVSWVFHEVNLFRDGRREGLHISFEAAQRIADHADGWTLRDLLTVEDIDSGAVDWILEQWARDQDSVELLATHYPNQVLRIRYEDLIAKPELLIGQLFGFLDIGLRKSELPEIMRSSSFEQFSGGRPRGVQDARHFYRSGTAGDYKNYLSDEISSLIFGRVQELAEARGYTVS